MRVFATSLVTLEYTDVAVISCLVLGVGILSALLRLRLEKQLLIASLRTVLQLIALGFTLRVLFSVSHMGWVMLAASAMTTIAAWTALQRSTWRVKGAFVTTAIGLWVIAMSIVVFVTAGVMQVTPWWRPQLLLPLLGMVLGNSLTGISLCVERLLSVLVEQADRIEADLAMGATRWEACKEPMQQAIRNGMIPILNAMNVVGLVSLPGMMTGQILQGADPIEAVKYQIIIMFMIVAAVSLGSIGVAFLIYRRTFNEKHQLLLGMVSQKKS